MARKPVVLEPPAPAREPVLLREGPVKRNWGTLLAAIFGALLLLVAVALIGILPEDEEPLPQYEVTFTEKRSTITGESLGLNEGETKTVGLPFSGESLFGIAISLSFQDDQVASLPDVFEVSLSHPNGTVVLGPKTMMNAQPENGANPGEYVANNEFRVLSFALAPRPGTEIISAPTHDATMEEMQALATQFHGEGPGEWQLDITLADAGDCPAPESIDPVRTLSCTASATGGTDDRNDIQILEVEFIEYTTSINPL